MIIYIMTNTLTTFAGSLSLAPHTTAWYEVGGGNTRKT